MSDITLTRLSNLKKRLDRLRKEGEAAVSNIKYVLSRGNSLFIFQESIQDLETFLKSYSIAVRDVDVLISGFVKLNCDLEISLLRKLEFPYAQEFEINYSLFDGECVCNCAHLCKTCLKEMSIDTSINSSESSRITFGTNTDLSAFTLLTVGTNTDLSTLSRETIGTNTDLCGLACDIGTNTGFRILTCNTFDTNPDVSASTLFNVGTSTDLTTLSREIVGQNTDLNKLACDNVSTSTDFSKLAHGSTSKIETVDYTCKMYEIQNESSLKMQGDDRTQRWLKYSLDCELVSPQTESKKKFNFGELKNLTIAPAVGKFFTGHVGPVFRGHVLSDCYLKIMGLDIDRGILKYVVDSDDWNTDHISKVSYQAMLHKLYNVPKELNWCMYLSKLFQNCLLKCHLIATVKDIIPGTIPTFVIGLKVHDESLQGVNIRECINSCVISAEERKSFHVSDCPKKIFFQGTNSYTPCDEKVNSNSTLHSKWYAKIVQENPEINDVLHIKATALSVKEREFLSRCVRENQLNDKNECILHICTKEKGPGRISSTDSFVVNENSEDNSEIIYLLSNCIKDQVFQKSSDQLINAELSEEHEPIFKSAIVQCCLEKDRILEMSFLQGNDPWCFILNYISKQDVIDVKKKIADRAQQGFLIPFPDMPVVGDFAVGKCDHEYLRVRITGISAQGSNKNIMCIDIDSSVSKLFYLNDLWVLEEEFSSLPALAVQCSLWNVPKNPFYWNSSLENLFKSALESSVLRVNVKDVEYVQSDWKHVVQIQVSEGFIFDVSEWIMQYVFPNIEKIRQCSVSRVSEVISNLDPAKLFKKEMNACESLQQFVHVYPTAEGKKGSGNKFYEESTDGSDLKSRIPRFVCVIPLGNLQTSQKEKFFGHITENYRVKEFCTKYLSKLNSNRSLFDFKKYSWGMEPSRKYDVFMACVISPYEFYVQVISDEILYITNMDKELSNYCSYGSIPFKNKKEAKRLILLCCAVQYRNQYCRARIIDWLDDSSDNALVYLVDHGIYASVHFSSIYSLRSDFYKCPIYSLKCRLSGILPPSTDGSWPDSSLEGLWNFIDYGSVYEIHIEKYMETEEALDVILLDSGSKKSINEYLIDNNFAVCQKCNDDKMAHHGNSHCTVGPIDVSKELPEDSCDNSDIYEDAEMQSYVDNIIALPAVGELLPVVISEIVNIGTFYAVSKKFRHKGISQNTDEVLGVLNAQIMSAVECALVTIPKHLVAGKLVIAYYSKDKKWYRARLLSTVDDSGYVEVLFVDLGILDNIYKFFIREMKKEFCEVPFQALKYSIDDIDITQLNDPCGQKTALVLLHDILGKRKTRLKVIRITNEDIFVKVLYKRCDIGAKMLALYLNAVK